MTIDTFVDDLIGYLQTAGFGTAGEDLVKNRLDETDENQIAVIPWQGTNPTDIKSGEDNLHEPKVSVIVRNSSESTAFQNIIGIYKLLRLKSNVRIGSTNFVLIRALGTPGFIGTTRTGAAIFSINFSLIFE